MAYSRWGQSRWFVFGCSKEDIPLEKQELAIFDSSDLCYHYTFSELKENIEKLLEKIQEDTKASETEIYELKEHMITFMREVQFGLARTRQMEKVDYFCEKHELLPLIETKSCLISDSGVALQLDYPAYVPDVEVTLWSKALRTLFFIGTIKSEEYDDRYSVLGVAMELTPTHYHTTVIHWVYKAATLPLFTREDPEFGS